MPQLLQRIAAAGTISVADYMGIANAHYYATRDPLGTAGDFITAPEISQMFGEMIGLWIADLWLRAGRPAFHYVELGPGRGTLAADALRAMAKFGCAAQSVQFVETSPRLRAVQAAAVAGAVHHDSIDMLPGDAPLIVVANEFFDALPVRQFVATHSGWRERMVGQERGALIALPGTVAADDRVDAPIRRQPPGTIVETCPAAAAIVAGCAQRLQAQGGAMLIADYGYCGPAAGDTLQAVRGHNFTDVFSDPGENDLTAHVDFAALAGAALPYGVAIEGPVSQGIWLRRLGIDARCAALVAECPGRAEELTGQRDRLVGDSAMGRLFQVLAFHSATWPVPEGFRMAPQDAP